MKMHQERISEALELAALYGQIEGSHHRLWVIDQMVRALTGEDYEDWIKRLTKDERGVSHPYLWDTGIVP